MAFGHPRSGFHLSATTKAKISAAERGHHRPVSAATKAKISAALTGKKHPHKGSHSKHRHGTHRTSIGAARVGTYRTRRAG